MASNIWENVTLRYWHGGRFSYDRNGVMIYVGGQGKTYDLLADELCYWEIVHLAKKAGGYDAIDGVYYQVLGLGLKEGMRKVKDDSDVIALAELATKLRTVDLYVQHQEKEPTLEQLPQPNTETHFQPIEVTSKPKKLPLRRGPTTNQKGKKVPEVILLGHYSPNDPNNKGERIFGDLFDLRKSEAEHISSATSPLLNAGPTNLDTLQINAAQITNHVPTNLERQGQNTSHLYDKAVQADTPVASTTSPPLNVGPTTSEFSQVNDLAGYEWIDPRPESPLSYHQLLGESSDDSEDPIFQPEEHNLSSDDELLSYEVNEVIEEIAGEEEEGRDEKEELLEESDNSDEEYHIARDRVKSTTTILLQIANQLEREAAEGKLAAQQLTVDDEPVKNDDDGDDNGCESEYNDSGDDAQTPPCSDEEGQHLRKTRRTVLVGAETDFSTFKWKVGQRFASREDFAVSKYGILQGRNIGTLISNKGRRGELGIKCVSGCPFYLYASWHSRKGTFIVRRVLDEHRCQRNMSKNRQLTTRWAAKEMLEVFKSRPHWPAKDIKETIKRAYKFDVTAFFAYKVKYKAHQMLHRSMQDHYLKVGRYIAAVKEASPATVMELVVDGSKEVNPPTFQRLFNCFDGLSKGWKEGCRRVICVDAAFLKTFLGGQILSAVGRDSNE